MRDGAPLLLETDGVRVAVTEAARQKAVGRLHRVADALAQAPQGAAVEALCGFDVALEALEAVAQLHLRRS